MNIEYGDGITMFGPGVKIELSGDEVANAISAWLEEMDIQVRGPRTITVNGEPCKNGRIYVDPEGFVIANGVHFSGRG